MLVNDRKQIKIFVSAKAKKVVEDFAEQFDMKEMGVASRIYSWFGTLPLPVQKWITGLTDGDEGKGMQEFAKALTSSARTKPFVSIPKKKPQDAPDDPPVEAPGQTGGGRGSGRSK